MTQIARIIQTQLDGLSSRFNKLAAAALKYFSVVDEIKTDVSEIRDDIVTINEDTVLISEILDTYEDEIDDNKTDIEALEGGVLDLEEFSYRDIQPITGTGSIPSSNSSLLYVPVTASSSDITIDLENDHIEGAYIIIYVASNPSNKYITLNPTGATGGYYINSQETSLVSTVPGAWIKFRVNPSRYLSIVASSLFGVRPEILVLYGRYAQAINYFIPVDDTGDGPFQTAYALQAIHKDPNRVMCFRGGKIMARNVTGEITFSVRGTGGILGSVNIVFSSLYTWYDISEFFSSKLLCGKNLSFEWSRVSGAVDHLRFVAYMDA